MITWRFASKDDLDAEMGIAAERWFDARELAKRFFGEELIEVGHKDGDEGAKYALRWTGNAVTSAGNLRLQIRKRSSNGRWSSWRFL